jgi:uncharacterized protein YeaO (DUF488 family)
MLRTKSVHSPIEASDGLRILVTRFRGHGLTKDRYDVWMPNLGPSEELLRRFQSDPKRDFRHFSSGYEAELFSEAAVDDKNQTIKNHGQKFTLRLVKRLARTQDVTLLCHCAEDERECHRHLLKRLIEAS